MDNPVNEDEIRKKIEKKVGNSGLILEEKVAKSLQKYFSIIRRNAHYLDKDEQKDRDIDFFASQGCYFIPIEKKKTQVYVVEMELIVECKKTPHRSWVFTGEEDDRISLFEKMVKVRYYPNVLMPEFVSSEELPEDTHIQEIIHPLTAKLFTAEGYLEVPIPNEKLKDQINEEENNGKSEPRNFLRKAILQVIKASRYRQDFVKNDYERWARKKRNSDTIFVTLFQPVIVFDGLMYKTVYNDDKLTVEPIKFARIEKEYYSSAHHETKGEIHIVSIQWFSEYLEMIKKNYQTMEINEKFWRFFGTRERRKGFL